MEIKLSSPNSNGEEVEALKRVLESGWWGSGKETYALEEELKKYHNSQKNFAAVNSGTSALHLIGKVMNLPQGSEVIIPAITFISTAYLATYNGLKPVYADVQYGDLNIDPEDVRKKITDKTKAIVAVHYGGAPADMDELKQIAKENDLFLIEDCAHALGATYKGVKVGTIGDAGMFSLQATKNLPCGDGGVIVTGRDEWDKRIRVLRKFGMNRGTYERATDSRYTWDYDIVEEGYKYEMTDLLACIAREQLKKLDKHNDLRRRQASRYYELFKDNPEVEIQETKPDRRGAFYNFHVKVPQEKRDAVMAGMREDNIHTTIHFKPLYLHTSQRQYRTSCPVAEKVWKEMINIPIHPSLSEEEQNKVAHSLERRLRLAKEQT